MDNGEQKMGKTPPVPPKNASVTKGYDGEAPLWLKLMLTTCIILFVGWVWTMILAISGIGFAFQIIESVTWIVAAIVIVGATGVFLILALMSVWADD